MKNVTAYSSLSAAFLVAALALAGCSSESPASSSPSPSTTEPTSAETSPTLPIAEQVTQALAALPELEGLQISAVSTSIEDIENAAGWVQQCIWVDSAPASKALSISRTYVTTPESSLNADCDLATTELHGLLRDNELVAPLREAEVPVAGEWEQTALPEAMASEAFEMMTGLSALKEAIEKAGVPVETTEKTASYDIARDDLPMEALEMAGALNFDRSVTTPFRVVMTMDDDARIKNYELTIDVETGDAQGSYEIVRTFTYDAPVMEEPADIAEWGQPAVTDAYDALFRMALVS